MIPCDMFVRKNHYALELTSANCHATLSHSKQLHAVMLALEYHLVQWRKDIHSGHTKNHRV